jgi:hypothetical protein
MDHVSLSVLYRFPTLTHRTQALQVRFIQSCSTFREWCYMVHNHCRNDTPLGGTTETKRMGSQERFAKLLPVPIVSPVMGSGSIFIASAGNPFRSMMLTVAIPMGGGPEATPVSAQARHCIGHKTDRFVRSVCTKRLPGIGVQDQRKGTGPAGKLENIFGWKSRE